MTARIMVLRTDITTLAVDAIVNAANSSLMGGGGVDGAIHRAAGRGLLQECIRLGGCPTGEARLTGGHALPARHVIHTVGPRWQGGSAGEDLDLANCYRNSLALAAQHRFKEVAIPAISTGIYGFPSGRAARIAVREVAAFLEAHDAPERVYLVAFDDRAKQTLEEALMSLGPKPPLEEPRLSLRFGDITAVGAEALVCSTDMTLCDGGPIFRAIHQAAGPRLLEACRGLGPCPIGEARLTPGFDLAAAHVIHTVPPTWFEGNRSEETMLASCYRNALAIARTHGIRSIAFPSLGSGHQPQIPLERAAPIAVRTILAFLEEHPMPEKVILVCFEREAFQLHQQVLRESLP